MLHYLSLILLVLFGAIMIHLTAETFLVPLTALIGLSVVASLMLMCLDFYFVAMSLTIVYVGSLAILFLFIVMLIPLKPRRDTGNDLVLSVVSIFAFLVWLASFSVDGSVSDSRAPLVRASDANPVSRPGIILERTTATATGLLRCMINYMGMSDIQNLGLFIICGWPVVLIMLGILLTTVLINTINIVI